MKKIWLVFCPYCNRTVTGATPPRHVDFIKKVNCVLCDKPIDANKGVFVFHPIVIKRERVNLLKVGQGVENVIQEVT